MCRSYRSRAAAQASAPLSGLRAVRFFVALCGAGLLPGPAQTAPPVRFRTDVMPILSKAGCNAGTCHGNFNGKNGFRLSLRGDNPDFDRDSLTRDTAGRRTNPLDP